MCLLQVVALMGAHSLGMASKSNSGYQGIWIPGGQFSLDSDYYAHMIDPRITWFNKNPAGRTKLNSEARWQFVGTLEQGKNGGFMLNTDFALFYDFQVRTVYK